jgi:hypothetical protein
MPRCGLSVVSRAILTESCRGQREGQNCGATGANRPSSRCCRRGMGWHGTRGRTASRRGGASIRRPFRRPGSGASYGPRVAGGGNRTGIPEGVPCGERRVSAGVPQEALDLVRGTAAVANSQLTRGGLHASRTCHAPTISLARKDHGGEQSAADSGRPSTVRSRSMLPRGPGHPLLSSGTHTRGHSGSFRCIAHRVPPAVEQG